MLWRRGIDATRPPGAIVHQVPQRPVLIDGDERDPKAVREYFDQPLHTVLDQEALEGGMLRIFTHWQDAQDHFRRLPTQMAPDPVHIPPQGGYVDLYEHVSQGGCTWRLLEHNGNEGDFTQVWACGFLWWGWKNANDQTSSVDVRVSHPDGGKSLVVLCEHIHLGGSWLWLPGDALVPNLVPNGWNDRASSMFILYLS